MHRVNSIYHVPSMVLEAWVLTWNDKTGFSMRCGKSRYDVPPHNKYDMWVRVRSNVISPRLRGRIKLTKKCFKENMQ